MLPKQYHAILFICILVMLLLLGLHLLGIGYGSGQATAKTAAALARDSSSQTTSSSTIQTAAQAYRHPIAYNKATGAASNDALNAGKQLLGGYPIDHYHQLQHQHQQQQQPSQRLQVNQLPHDDFFDNIHRQGGGPGAFSHHMHIPLSPPPPPPPMQIPSAMMTTQRPQPPLPPPGPRQLQLGPPLPPMAPPPPQRPSDSSPAGGSTGDSIPSASSQLDDNSRSRVANSQQNATIRPTPQQQQQQAIYQQQQQQQPPRAYYTPPIFAYNNFDQNRPLGLDAQLAAQLPFGLPQQPQQPPLGVPEAPLSIDEYNARQQQARLRPQPLVGQNEVAQIDRYGKPARPPQLTSTEPTQFTTTSGQPNLLADPQEQQRHKQQMLDRNQLLFGGPAHYAPLEINNNNNNQSYYEPAVNGALYRPLLVNSSPNSAIRPPYAHNVSPPPPPASTTQNNNNNNNNNINRMATNRGEASQPTSQKLVANNFDRPAAKMLPASQQAQVMPLPACARNQQQVSSNETNSLTSTNSTFSPVLFCNEDADYPTKEIMRALEIYAGERSIEQLLPQSLVQIHLAQRTPDARQLPVLDALQPNIAGKLQQESGELAQQVPSGNYEPLCRSNIFMAQPRRAKSLMGQWKVVVNLPGHKYRGIAISQMLRIEECSRPNTECANGPPAQGLGGVLSAKSRCLQQYENQRLVAWSPQQGLHVDIFRVPIACSCHNMRRVV